MPRRGEDLAQARLFPEAECVMEKPPGHPGGLIGARRHRGHQFPRLLSELAVVTGPVIAESDFCHCT